MNVKLDIGADSNTYVYLLITFFWLFIENFFHVIPCVVVLFLIGPFLLLGIILMIRFQTGEFLRLSSCRWFSERFTSIIY